MLRAADPICGFRSEACKAYRHEGSAELPQWTREAALPRPATPGPLPMWGSPDASCEHRVCHASRPIRAQRIVTGVPIGMRVASRRIAGLGTRMHPCDGRPGISQGWLVP